MNALRVRLFPAVQHLLVGQVQQQAVRAVLASSQTKCPLQPQTISPISCGSQICRQLCTRNDVKLCWSCGIAVHGPIFCRGCTAVQPVCRSNYFSVFGLPHKFEIDEGKLDQSFRNLQKKLHPDVVAHRPDSEKRFGGDQSMYINQAYDTLKSPLQRALYLLELQGRPISEEQHVFDSEFLEEQLDAREALAEGGERAREVVRTVVQRRKQAEREVLEAFNKGDLDLAHEATIRLCYAVKLEDIATEQT